MVNQRSEIGHNTAPEPFTIEGIQDRLSSVLRQISGKEDGEGQVNQLRFRIEDIDPFRWVRDQPFQTKFVWQDRGSGEVIAGVGIADEIKGAAPDSMFASSENRTRMNHIINGAKYYGGLRFDSSLEPASEWRSFGAYRFFLPRFEIHKKRDATFLQVNLNPTADSRDADRVLEHASSLIFAPLLLKGELPLPLSRADTPSKQEWIQSISHLLALLDNLGNPLQKIVLARQVVFRFPEPIDRYLLFKYLAHATPHCYHFLFQFEDDYAFIGATPERLYRRTGRRVESEAVAGTGLRDDALDVDAYLGNALLSSDKDQREHAFVRASIVEAFDNWCSQLHIDSEASLMNLSIGRHLRSRFEGVLQDHINDVDMLSHLPPTSAVGGHPRNEALQKIHEIEPFDRGWYAGAVGWISQSVADFAVAIRSGLVAKDHLRLYSGAGIVQGSDAESEWAEIEQKLGDFINVLGLDHKRAKY